MIHQIQAIIILAYRDVLRFLRDRTRITATFIFPLIFVGVLGKSLEANLGADVGYSFLTFTFTGVLAQTLFQSTAAGIISLIEDRENNFSQEIFVSPISRYSIIVGKILGETFVSLLQAMGIIAFGLLLGVQIRFEILLELIPVAFLISFLGGAFGIMVLANINSQRASNQIFPFLIFPQIFLSGVFSPIKELPWYLFLLSRITPMTYAVDLLRSVYYQDLPEASRIVLFPLEQNILIAVGLFFIFLVAGTYFFMRNEKNR